MDLIEHKRLILKDNKVDWIEYDTNFVDHLMIASRFIAKSMEVTLPMAGIRHLISTVSMTRAEASRCQAGEKTALSKRFANAMDARCMARMKNCRRHTIAN